MRSIHHLPSIQPSPLLLTPSPPTPPTHPPFHLTAQEPSGLESLIDGVKTILSLILVVVSGAFVCASIFTEQTAAFVDYGFHPIVTFAIFVGCIIWLAMIEGGQGCLVGLSTIESKEYASTHPTTANCTALVRGDNLERFVVGRQFLVVLLIFIISTMGGAVADADVLNAGELMNKIFLGNGVAMMVFTISIGQLTSQVLATPAMLDFINNNFMLFCTYFSLGIEATGLLHSVYLVQYVFSAITGKAIESKEGPRSGFADLMFWGRVLLSLAILGFSLAVAFDSLFADVTKMYEGVPSGLSIAIFFVLLCIVGILEGLQIAAFAVLKMPKENYAGTIAGANCDLLFRNKSALPKFLVGRQIVVASLMFTVGRVVSVDAAHAAVAAGRTSFDVSDDFQSFLNLNFCGALITTILGSLIWRVVAGSYPLIFMSNPVIYVLINFCYLLEATGLFSSSFAVAKTANLVFRLRDDDHYLNVEGGDDADNAL
jgi:hypothetical protein